MQHVVGASILTFPMLSILTYRMLCELRSHCFPNLPSFQWQEGGAQPSLYELLYRNLFLLYLLESYS